MNPTRQTGSSPAILLSVLLFSLVGCGRDTVPEELLGRWTTADVRYEGRAFELTDSAIRIFTAPEKFEQHRISGVDIEVLDGGEVLLTIDYEAEGRSLQFSVAYERPGPDGVPGWVHLANQPDFEWRRSAAGPHDGP